MTQLFRSLILMACFAAGIAPARADELDDILQRLQIMEDREAIRSLIIAYGRAHDGRDYKAYSELTQAPIM